MQFDETDRNLLSLLLDNARLPVADIARRLDLARSTVQSRIERLERSGAIAAYTIRLGAEARDPVRATALISVEARQAGALLARLRAIPEVERVHTTSGRFDLLVQIAARSTERLDAILDAIGDSAGVRSSESLIHLSTKLDRAP